MNAFSRHILFFCCILTAASAYCQNSEPISSVRIKDGAAISTAIPVEKRFLYPQFVNSTVRFRNRPNATVRMNYSLVYAQLQFIAPNGDTLLISEPESIDNVVIGSDIYYFSKKEGHLREVLSEEHLILVEKTQLTYAGTERYSAYGQYSSTGAITSYTSYVPGAGAPQKLESNNQNVMIKRNTFFFIDKNQRFYAASRSSLLKIFPKNKKELNAYFNQNLINFDDEAHLKDLVVFCADF